MAITRDTHLPAEHFRKFIAENVGFIAEDLATIESGTWGPHDIYPIHNRLEDMLFETMLASYSAGDGMDLVEQHFKAYLAYLPKLQAAREGIEDSVRNGYSSYNDTMRLLSLAILFNVRGDDLSPILNEIAFFPVSDVLTETILARITGQDRITDPAPLGFPKTFQDLLNAYEWDDMASKSALKTYMEKWYSNNQDAYWHDRHKKNTVTGYFGYWSLETAAASVILDVDDTFFRDHPYYPKDLADWARKKG